MAALAHLGIGLAAKRVNPKVPLYILIIVAWAADIIWGIFFLFGLESYPSLGKTIPSPWSHGLLTNVIWSFTAFLVTKFISRNTRTSIFIGFLFFSHWVIDFLTHPMRAFMPDDPPLPLLFNGSPAVGLGLYSTQLGVYIGEYATLIVGIMFYILALRKLKQTKQKENFFVSE